MRATRRRNRGDKQSAVTFIRQMVIGRLQYRHRDAGVRKDLLCTRVPFTQQVRQAEDRLNANRAARHLLYQTSALVRGIRHFAKPPLQSVNSPHAGNTRENVNQELAVGAT